MGFTELGLVAREDSLGRQALDPDLQSKHCLHENSGRHDEGEDLGTDLEGGVEKGRRCEQAEGQEVQQPQRFSTLEGESEGAGRGVVENMARKVGVCVWVQTCEWVNISSLLVCWYACVCVCVHLQVCM